MGYGAVMALDDDNNERRRDFARRRRLFNKEGRGARSGMTGMVGQLASRLP
jgi:hypothetical protein